jgi:hypothetical protein
MSDHERAVNAALAVNRELGAIFGRLGTADHPRGAVVSAYRAARRALDGNLGQPRTVAEILAVLRAAVLEAVRAAIRQGSVIGSASAEKQLQAYGFQPVLPLFNPELGVSATTAVLDGQIATVTALALTAVGADLILGDDERVGLLSPGRVNGEATRWASLAASNAQRTAFDATLGGDPVWHKQAVAAIDDRTTDCCLQVNGQTVPMDDEFVLTGTPRYADRLGWPAFHWYCRTSVAMVRAQDAGDNITQGMVDAAQSELSARGPGGKNRVPIYPVHSRSRRKG